MNQVVKTTPVIRCIIWKQEDCSILFCRKTIELTENGTHFDSSHWELPLCKKLRRETAVEAAERVAYDTAGIYAGEAQLLRQPITDFSQTFFHASHHYVLLSDVSGRFDQDDNESGKEGRWQWIPYEHMGAYAVRRETVAMIKQAVASLPCN